MKSSDRIRIGVLGALLVAATQPAAALSLALPGVGSAAPAIPVVGPLPVTVPAGLPALPDLSLNESVLLSDLNPPALPSGLPTTLPALPVALPVAPPALPVALPTLPSGLPVALPTTPPALPVSLPAMPTSTGVKVTGGLGGPHWVVKPTTIELVNVNRPPLPSVPGLPTLPVGIPPQLPGGLPALPVAIPVGLPSGVPSVGGLPVPSLPSGVPPLPGLPI